MQTNIFLRK